MKTYAELLKESRKRPPSLHLMPPTARPKSSRGDYPKSRELKRQALLRGYVDLEDLKFTKEGTINTKQIKPLRKKIYKLQEANHGR